MILPSIVYKKLSGITLVILLHFSIEASCSPASLLVKVNEEVFVVPRQKEQQQQQQQNRVDLCAEEKESESIPIYHSHEVCDYRKHNKYRSRNNIRARSHKRILMTGTQNIANERTIVCPDPSERVQDLHNADEDYNYEYKYNHEDFDDENYDYDHETSKNKNYVNGIDNMVIFENTASIPVVLSWVKKGDRMREYSAVNSKITPAHHDPDAILQPGEWRSFHSFEGHVFHVRALPSLDPTESDDDANISTAGGRLGKLLLQHRPGMIPIRNKYGPSSLRCNSNNETDPEKVSLEEKQRQLRKKHRQTHQQENPKYASAPKQHYRPCNALDIGFRNEIGCPLHAYKVPSSSYRNNNNNITDTLEEGKEQRQMDCNKRKQSKFMFHLGTNKEAEDFAHDKDSNTKYFETYVGHTFEFRLPPTDSSKDDGILVDTYQVQPTFIVDCPHFMNKKRKEHLIDHSPTGKVSKTTTDSGISTNSDSDSATSLQNNDNLLSMNSNSMVGATTAMTTSSNNSDGDNNDAISSMDSGTTTVMNNATNTVFDHFVVSVPASHIHKYIRNVAAAHQ